MCLRFVFLLITRTASGLRLSGREEAWRTAEILILRHQLAVLHHASRDTQMPLGPFILTGTLAVITV
jgi:hypothetical protein